MGGSRSVRRGGLLHAAGPICVGVLSVVALS